MDLAAGAVPGVGSWWEPEPCLEKAVGPELVLSGRRGPCLGAGAGGPWGPELGLGLGLSASLLEPDGGPA